MAHISMLLTWSAIALIATISPGPDMLLVVGYATRRGSRAGLAAAIGIAAGGVWYMALCGLGFLSLLNASPVIFEIVRTIGACYLAWLGIKLIRGAVSPPIEGAVLQPEIPGAPFRQAFITNIFNPKIALFYLAVLPQFVGTGMRAPYLGMLLIAIHYLIALVWFCGLAIAVGRAGSVIRCGAIRWIEGVLGAAFLGLAARLALSRA